MSTNDRKLSKWCLVAPIILLLAIVGLCTVAVRLNWLRFSLPAGTVITEPAENLDDADEAMVMSTTWTDQLEVFLEYADLAVGQAAEIAVHVTLLETGEPLTKGTLRLRLVSGEEVHVVEVKSPVAAGVWLMPVRLPKAGAYEAQLDIDSPALADGTIAVKLATMTVHDSHAAANAAAKASPKGKVGEIELLKEQQWRIGLRSEVSQAREIAECLVVPGKIVAPHGSEALIVPTVPGRVLPPPQGAFPDVGNRVTAGQVVAVMEPSVAGAQSVQLLVNQAQLRTLDAELTARQLEVEAKLASSKADLELFGAEVRRLEGLAGKGVVADKRLQEARHRQKQAEALLEGYTRLRDTYAEAHGRLARFLGDVRRKQPASGDEDSLKVPLLSPIAGSVVVSNATAGESVGDDQVLFQIVDMQRLFIDAEVSEYDLAKVEKSPGAKFRLSAYPDRILPIVGPGKGRLVFIGAVVNPESRTVSVRYEVPNEEGLLRLGMFADVMIETSRQRGLVVRAGAVVDDSGEPVVYVQTGGQTFERRPVQLGLRDGDDIELRSGVETGERIVTQGAYAIRLSTLAGAVPEHHHHH